MIGRVICQCVSVFCKWWSVACSRRGLPSSLEKEFYHFPVKENGKGRVDCITKNVKNKHHHRSLLFNSFASNDHTLGFRPQTQNSSHLVKHNKQHHSKVLLSSFHLNVHNLGFHPQSQKLEPHYMAEGCFCATCSENEDLYVLCIDCTVHLVDFRKVRSSEFLAP